MLNNLTFVALLLSAMKEEHQKQLVQVWKDDCLELSFDTWKSHMEKYYKRALTDQLPDLAKNISIDSGLFSQLQRRKVFDRRVLETLEVQVLKSSYYLPIIIS